MATSLIPNQSLSAVSRSSWLTVLKAADKSMTVTAVNKLVLHCPQSITYQFELTGLTAVVFPVGRLILRQQVVFVAVISELVQCAFFDNFGYEL